MEWEVTAEECFPFDIAHLHLRVLYGLNTYSNNKYEKMAGASHSFVMQSAYVQWNTFFELAIRVTRKKRETQCFFGNH